jgi:hypothetical protein
MAMGVLLPHAFINPPRKMGTYVISHDLNTGEFCIVELGSCLFSQFTLFPYLEKVKTEVTEGRDDIDIESYLRC